MLLLPAIALVFILGIVSQWLSWRFKLPSIVLLSVTGLILGPGLDWISPSRDFGTLLETIVKLAVAIILFEGGLNLRFHELKTTGKALRQLIGLGLPLSWFFGYLACRVAAGLSIPVSLLLSSILVVTGPTVIMPLIRQTRLQPRTASLLKWEGIINDPLGVLLAVLVFQFAIVTEHAATGELLVMKLAMAIAAAILIGVAAAFILKFLFEKGHVPEFLKLPMVLSTVLAIYAFANLMQEEIGLLAVTVLGMTMGNIGMLIIYELRKFKETITVVLVSVVFILLTADTNLQSLTNLNWRAAAFILCILFLVRPLAVWISTLGSGMTWKEKLFVGWIAPRGIVAASVAGLFGLEMAKHGFDDAHLLSPLVFLVIFSTVVLHGFSIQWLSRRLGLASHAQEGVLIIGSYPFTIELARVLKSSGYPVLLVDSSWHSLREARLIGLPVHYGEILSDTTEENLDLSEMGYLFAATGNDAYNSLVCNAFVSHFGRDRVFQLGVHEKESGKEMRGSARGRIAFGGKLHYEELIIRYFEGWRFQKTRLTKEFDYADFLQAASDNRQPLILLKKNSRIDFDFMQNNTTPEPDDTIISFSLQKTEPEKR